MWENNHQTVLVSFMAVLPQSLLLQTMHHVKKRFHWFHRDYAQRKATQLVYATAHKQFFVDQLHAYERLVRRAPPRAGNARQTPRSDFRVAESQRLPLLTEAAAGFAPRLLSQYDRLVAARKIHYFIQKCHSRGRQSGTIRLENTAMLLSQKRPRRQTRRSLYTCQSQCILLFQQQFESDWAVVSSRRMKDGHLQVSHQKETWAAGAITNVLAGLEQRAHILGLSPVCLPLHVYFAVARRYAASKLHDAVDVQLRVQDSGALGAPDPASDASDASVFASACWSEFASAEELKFVAETIDGATVSCKHVEALVSHNEPAPRTDLPRAVSVRFPSGQHSHVCVEAHRTLCGQRIQHGRPLSADVGSVLPTCSRCLTSGTPWVLPGSEARELATLVSAMAAERRNQECS